MKLEDAEGLVEWVERIVSKRLGNVVAVIDTIPAHEPHFLKWRMARDEAESAKSEVSQAVQLVKSLKDGASKAL